MLGPQWECGTPDPLPALPPQPSWPIGQGRCTAAAAADRDGVAEAGGGFAGVEGRGGRGGRAAVGTERDRPLQINRFEKPHRNRVESKKTIAGETLCLAWHHGCQAKQIVSPAIVFSIRLGFG